MNKLIILTGLSAAGKGTIMNLLVNDTDLNIDKLVRYTTRPRRDGEVDDVSYHFVSDEKFAEMNNDGDFVDAFKFPLGWFGTSKSALLNQMKNNKNVAIDLDVDAAFNLIKFAKEQDIPYIDIFLIPGKKEDMETSEGIERIVNNVAERMVERNGGLPYPEHDLKVRLNYAREWLGIAKKFSHVVGNETGKLNEAYEKVKLIIKEK